MAQYFAAVMNHVYDSALNRNDAVVMRHHGGRSGDASSPGPGGPPNRARNLTPDEGVAPTFCDEASQLRSAAAAAFRLRPVAPWRQAF